MNGFLFVHRFGRPNAPLGSGCGHLFEVLVVLLLLITPVCHAGVSPGVVGYDVRLFGNEKGGRQKADARTEPPKVVGLRNDRDAPWVARWGYPRFSILLY